MGAEEMNDKRKEHLLEVCDETQKQLGKNPGSIVWNRKCPLCDADEKYIKIHPGDHPSPVTTFECKKCACAFKLRCGVHGDTMTIVGRAYQDTKSPSENEALIQKLKELTSPKKSKSAIDKQLVEKLEEQDGDIQWRVRVVNGWIGEEIPKNPEYRVMVEFNKPVPGLIMNTGMAKEMLNQIENALKAIANEKFK